MRTRNRVGIGLLYQPARARICKPFKEPGIDSQHGQAGTTTLLVVPARQVTLAGRIDSSESIPGLLKRLQIRAQAKLASGIGSME